MERSIDFYIKTYGFEDVRIRRTYAPLKLECIAISGKKFVLAANEYGRKEFKNRSKYKLYVLYGRDFFGECHLYCNDTPNTKAYQVCTGYFEFVFNAEEFFQLLINASKQNWKNFTQNTIATNIGEIRKFEDMVSNSQRLTHKQQCRASNFIKDLKETLLHSL